LLHSFRISDTSFKETTWSVRSFAAMACKSFRLPASSCTSDSRCSFSCDKISFLLSIELNFSCSVARSHFNDLISASLTLRRMLACFDSSSNLLQSSSTDFISSSRRFLSVLMPCILRFVAPICSSRSPNAFEYPSFCTSASSASLLRADIVLFATFRSAMR